MKHKCLKLALCLLIISQEYFYKRILTKSCFFIRKKSLKSLFNISKFRTQESRNIHIFKSLLKEFIQKSNLFKKRISKFDNP